MVNWFKALRPLHITCLGLIVIFSITACQDEPAPNYGDPIPNARAGLEAFFSGDAGGISDFFCDEIVLSVKQQANQAALGEGRIDFKDAEFEISNRQTDTNWTLKLQGEYSIWLYDQEEIRNTDEIGALYVGMVVEDDIWKICAFAGEDASGE